VGEATYSVIGMTCDHCVRAVEGEIAKIAGVASVAVDLSAGRVILRSEEPGDPDAGRAAVEEAGYEVAG
jgi:copper chaperone